MADSVDRVFAHALNTVKRIPPLGSARPPPSERYRLYGLYKQSMEGDVDRVMARPSGRGEDQAKWDAWNSQKGLSRTEAKRQYISTLIDTMHRYASQTPDARELVSELEFVWSQIKSNPASDSSGHSPSNSNSNGEDNNSHSHSHSHSNTSYPPTYSYHPQTQTTSSGHSSDPPIYPLMSDRGSRHPRRDDEKTTGTDGGRLRLLSPISQSQQADPGAEGEETDADIEVEDFVDAPDSQLGMNDLDNRSGSQHSSDPDAGGGADPGGKNTAPGAIDPRRPSLGSSHARQKPSTAGLLLAPVMKYFSAAQASSAKLEDATSRWQRRVEAALIKLNAEVAALREQLDEVGAMERERASGGLVESIVHPFGGSSGGFSRARRRKGVLRLILDPVINLAAAVVKIAIVNAAVVAVVVGFMHYRGIPVERLEELVKGWIGGIQQLRILQRVKRMGESRSAVAAQRAALGVGMAMQKTVGGVGGMGAMRSRRD